ncbi:hypothetical protein ATY77_31615 [Rhizobium sp. R634]|nr:hypothetical protein ATY77_31615 [Rhizobium sp. R634]
MQKHEMREENSNMQLDNPDSRSFLCSSQESSAPKSLGAGDSFTGEVIHRADARWLDSCDEHRNEGEEVGASRQISVSAIG